MSSRDDLDRAISLLRDGPIALSDPTSAAVSRERTLNAMRALVIGTPRRLRRGRLLRHSLAGCGIATCLAVGWFGLDSQRYPPAMADTVLVEMPKSSQAAWIDGKSKTQLLGTRSRVPMRGSLHSFDDDAVTMFTPQGVRVALGARAQVTLDEVAASPGRSVLRLGAGSIRCAVPHLAPGSVFSVRTSDTEITVHGTVFSVEAPHGLQPSCVRVEEGRVEVRHAGHSAMLDAGSSFGCERVSVARARNDKSDALTSEPSATVVTARLHHPAGATRRASAAAPNASGTLAEESRLLAAALVAEREGAKANARALFVTLVTRYPQSALSTEARAGLLRTRDAETK